MIKLFILSFIVVLFYSNARCIKITQIINRLPVPITFHDNNSNLSLNLSENSIATVNIDIPNREITTTDKSIKSNYFPKADFSVFITHQQLGFDIKFFKHLIMIPIFEIGYITKGALNEIRYCYQLSNKNNIYNLDSKIYSENRAPKKISLTFKPEDQKTNYNINCDIEVLKWAKKN